MCQKERVSCGVARVGIQVRHPGSGCAKRNVLVVGAMVDLGADRRGHGQDVPKGTC